MCRISSFEDRVPKDHSRDLHALHGPIRVKTRTNQQKEQWTETKAFTDESVCRSDDWTVEARDRENEISSMEREVQDLRDNDRFPKHPPSKNPFSSRYVFFG